ncbi:ArsA family ATPase [Pseudogracilibacillus auburnensis]|uniref:Arsenite efflux ATP-binding protein ArsA n=1 Tax=Pseudogracilibacillus auburnensis TaxID=1494959 RepID=A0A2V3W4L3_9BACI|nr:ArsA family ATPase [Pseudogracilibacillus auburnensis]MBO1003595.1 ArsA family ATPase [Pseudogracilibacillus auburnensis]PXW89283.1 arsenite efflux ATP-binding protein ArsA [Pseudogracilibacillus auburnensis]
MEILHKKIIFVGGKGGVGKSTSSAALALQSAQKGYKTLLISTDPAHNIGHIFERKVGGETTKIADHLYALEIDPEKETKKYIKTVKENIQGVVQPTMMEEVHRQLDTAQASPGADEAALFDKLITIILEESADFDKLVFDTAPTGHTIRLLSLPELMGIWIQGLLEKRHKTKENYAKLLHDGEPIDDPIFEVLKERQARFKQAREIMLDDKQTGFIFVLNPEQLPILETKNAIRMLDKYHLHVKTLIVNRVLPNDDEGEFFKQRKKHEQKYVEKIQQTFSDKQLFFVPFFSHDIINVQQLEKFSTYLVES